MAPQAFTVRFSGRVKVLLSKVTVYEAFDPATEKPGTGVEFIALWDTGATNTLITQKVVDALGLQPTGFATAHHAQGTTTVETYFVNIWLPNNVGAPMVKVSKGVLMGEADLLIGMDIIGAGDFAVTNYHGKTTFTFRVPSAGEIDFVASASQPVHSNKVSRNATCPCGSGKKYKNCCGR